MEVSLKDVNKLGLALVAVANAVIYYALLTTGFSLKEISAFLVDYEKYVPATFAVIIVGVLNALLDHNTKARLIFWRWKHPLPGSYAFTHVMYTDTRIDPDALRTYHDPLPEDPADQNRLWFKWYREFHQEKAIAQVHREYLFTRDWCGLSCLLTFALGSLAIWQAEIKTAGIYIAFMVGQYLLVRIAARNHGKRFVAGVLAYKSSEPRNTP